MSLPDGVSRESLRWGVVMVVLLGEGPGATTVRTDLEMEAAASRAAGEVRASNVVRRQAGHHWLVRRTEVFVRTGRVWHRPTGWRDGSGCLPSGYGAPMPECSGPATVVFDKSLTEYDFGPAHPMSPIRVDLTMRLAEELGVLDHGLRIVPAPMADEARIATVHDPRLIAAVERAGTTPGVLDEEFGLGTDDNPTFRGMHHAAAHIVGASVEAFRQVWTGESLHAVNIAGRAPPRHARPGQRILHLQRRRPSASSTSSTRARNGSRTSTSTCTTGTASSGSSGTTRGC